MSKQFSHYAVGDMIGRGGMGEVYRARDTRLNRDVALKLLPVAFAGDAERLARFEREARLLASLTHPHIAAIHGLEEDGGRRALVLEYVPGDDLSGLIERGPLPIDDALEVARQVAEALEAAHEQGVIHRDLKPGNIKVVPDGTVKVLDFGLAKALEGGPAGEASDPSITQSPTVMGTAQGVILGTAAYMSPEQARGKPVDKRADIWAFGCVLFEMLTAIRTFAGETISDTVAAILRADPQWERLPDNTPGAIRVLLRRCLEKDPRERLRDIGEARIAIDAVREGGLYVAGDGLAGNGTSVTPGREGEARTSGAKAVPSRRGARRVLPVFTALFAAAWIAFMTLFLIERGKEERRPVIRALITPEEGKMFDNESYGAQAFHALSPDGNMITFISDDHLWVRSLGQINATRLPATQGAKFPFWSADGSAIGFFSDGKLKTVPAGGGPVTVVSAAPDARGGTWNQDDVIVFTPSLRTGLYRVPATGGTPEPVTEVKRPTHSTHRWPRFLPDGEHILYMAANHTNPKGAQTAIYATSLSGGETKLLVPSDSHPVYASGHLLYTRDRNLMAHPFDAGRIELGGDPFRIAVNCAHNGGSWVGVYDARADVLTYQGDAPLIGSVLTWMDEDGNASGTIGGRALHWDVAVSRDGRQVAIARGNPEPSIYLYEVERKVESRLTVDGSFSRAPVWSPDGERIAYASIRDNGRLNVYVVPVDRSSPPQPLIVDDVDMIPTSWSPDGTKLVVDHGDPGETEVWVFDMEGATEATPLVQTRPWVYGGVLSPDGSWLAYVSREDGRDEVFVVPFPGPGGKVKVSSNGGSSPEWGTGNRLYFASGSRAVMATTILGGGESVIVSGQRSLFPIRDDTSFFVQSGSALASSPDGRLLCKLAEDEPAELTTITLVVGWPSELRGR